MRALVSMAPGFTQGLLTMMRKLTPNTLATGLGSVIFGLLLMNVPPLDAADAASFFWDDNSKLHGQFGAYAHYGSSDDYEGPPILVNLEVNRESNWIYGLSLFNNSFGQFSQYLYLGKKWQLPKIQKYLHVKLTGGVVHGYKDEFEDKLAFNSNGFAPGIVPSIGTR